MLPIGLLMKEHRLIEEMIEIMAEDVRRMKQGQLPENNFIDTAIDFLRTYADRCHHGKEEDILFRDLAKKNLSAEHKTIMDNLKKEHVWGRETVGKLAEAKTKFAQGDQKAKNEIVLQMEELINFYPKHIKTEDEDFFVPCMEYFTDEEKKAMLKECYYFDQKLIHEKYLVIVEDIKKSKSD